MKSPEKYEEVATSSAATSNGQVAATLALAASVSQLARVQALAVLRSHPGYNQKALAELARIALGAEKPYLEQGERACPDTTPHERHFWASAQGREWCPGKDKS